VYATRVVERGVERFEAKSGITLKRYDIEKVVDVSDHLRSLLQPDGRMKRDLRADEQAFIYNERVMTQVDYRYWFDRYWRNIRDGVEGGGFERFEMWESQRILVDLIAKIQDQEWEKRDKGQPVDGVLIADHKARQVGHTAIARSLSVHRMTRLPYQRCAAISVDEKKTHEIYDRDKLCYDGLPWYLKPPLEFDVKDAHLKTSGLGSYVNYMQSNMQSSLGQSMQFDFSHGTEVSEYPNPGALEIDFFPAIPQHPDTVCILESRANGRENWWRTFTEDVRQGNYTRWHYCFCPWYAEPKKYRRLPPDGWVPDDITMAHASLVWDTSPEFVGYRVRLSKEQLYWWWSTRDEYARKGTLNFFLTDYAATPEQSFQHSGVSAFDTDYLDALRTKAKWGEAYEVVAA
jgi:hypothetical protein